MYVCMHMRELLDVYAFLHACCAHTWIACQMQTASMHSLRFSYQNL